MLEKNEIQYLIAMLEKAQILGRDSLGVLTIFKKLDAMLNEGQQEVPAAPSKLKAKGK